MNGPPSKLEDVSVQSAFLQEALSQIYSLFLKYATEAFLKLSNNFGHLTWFKHSNVALGRAIGYLKRHDACIWDWATSIVSEMYCWLQKWRQFAAGYREGNQYGLLKMSLTQKSSKRAHSDYDIYEMTDLRDSPIFQQDDFLLHF